MSIKALHNDKPVSGKHLQMLCQVWERQRGLPSGSFAHWIKKGTPGAKDAICNFSNGELTLVKDEVAA